MLELFLNLAISLAIVANGDWIKISWERGFKNLVPRAFALDRNFGALSRHFVIRPECFKIGRRSGGVVFFRLYFSLDRCFRRFFSVVSVALASDVTSRHLLTRRSHCFYAHVLVFCSGLFRFLVPKIVAKALQRFSAKKSTLI